MQNIYPSKYINFLEKTIIKREKGLHIKWDVIIEDIKSFSKDRFAYLYNFQMNCVICYDPLIYLIALTKTILSTNNMHWNMSAWFDRVISSRIAWTRNLGLSVDEAWVWLDNTNIYLYFSILQYIHIFLENVLLYHSHQIILFVPCHILFFNSIKTMCKSVFLTL